MASHRRHLWSSVPLGPVARAAVAQTFAGAYAFTQTGPGTMGRLAVIGFTTLGLLTLPLGRLASRYSREHPSVYYWSARVWAALLPAIFALTIADAQDGTGPVFAKKMCDAPLGLVSAAGVCFAIGAQGALLSVPPDLWWNVTTTMLTMAGIKLHTAYTDAYLALHAVSLGAIALGYWSVARYADMHEAVREAAEEHMRQAVAVNQPYVIADGELRILAVNQRFTEVLGYTPDEVYGQHASTLLETSLDAAWVDQVLAQDEATHVWSVVAKDGKTMPVRITLGAQRCPVNATKFYWAKLSSMWLEQRNMQLEGEKERLQWDLVSQHSDDPREHLGAVVGRDCDCVEGECECPPPEKGQHRTLGAMQDQEETDRAVSCANSFDHVASTASPTVPGQTLIAPAPPRSQTSPASSGGAGRSSVGVASVRTLTSSEGMDTVSEAAKKSPTRAPPPPKKGVRFTALKTASEPSSSRLPRPTPATTVRSAALPVVERPLELRESG